MNRKSLHPNTMTLLSAWERISTSPRPLDQREKSTQHADIIQSLFVIERKEDGIWTFRSAGDQMSSLLGRELEEHNYLNLWTGHDRQMLTSFMMAVIESRQPGIVRARGETLTGQRIDIEMTLAPLTSVHRYTRRVRLLGLYQPLGGADMLKGRPVWRHRLTALLPPEIQSEGPQLKLVANND